MCKDTRYYLYRLPCMYHLFYILSKDIKRKNYITGTQMGRINAKNGDFIEKTHTDSSTSEAA